MRERSFASDNNSGVHPEVMKAIERVNSGHVVGYGDDPYTESAIARFKEIFGKDIEVFFVYGGTGANVTALKAVTDSYHAIICSDSSHINTDECGAPEKFTGCKLKDISTKDGKLTPELIASALHGRGDEHQSQARVVSITQSTELGTVYRVNEIKEVARFAAANKLLLHMDGARICNAAASLGCSLKEMTTDAGVDILSFGGTKNGMMYGEAVIFFKPELAKTYRYFRKQGMQLASKMRYIAAQFDALLTDELWLNNARHANEMASILKDKLGNVPGVEIVFPVESNAVFAKIDKKYIPAIQKEFFFYIVDENLPIVRWMPSFDTELKDVEEFVNVIKSVIK